MHNTSAPSFGGVVDNSAPGPVCQVCVLPIDAQSYATAARAEGTSYADIAYSLTLGLGRGMSWSVSEKALWHHLNHSCKGTRGSN